MLRCGVCGDKTPADQEHLCWAYTKLQEPKVPELCNLCGDPLDGGLAHWRCWQADREAGRAL